jgi:hypothetical protein
MCATILTLTQLRDKTDNCNYENWNTTSVQILYATITTYSEGTEERYLSMNLLGEFIDWRKEQPTEYLPKNGLEYMYSTNCLVETYEYLLEHPPPSEDESMKEHNDYKKSIQEYFDYIRTKYPIQIENLETLQSRQTTQK